MDVRDSGDGVREADAVRDMAKERKALKQKALE